jgi:hypothetical protein
MALQDTLTEKLCLTPKEYFPEDLARVGDRQFQVLDSQVQPQVGFEVVAAGGGPGDRVSAL